MDLHSPICVKFSFISNLKAAGALGLSIPREALSAADEIIGTLRAAPAYVALWAHLRHSHFRIFAAQIDPFTPFRRSQIPAVIAS